MEGYGRCQNVECESFDVLKPLPFERQSKAVRAEDLPITVTETQYDVFPDGAEHCPDCDEPRALLNEKPRKIPKYV